MNFLAHAWLSFHDPDLLAGNMMADFVRGKQMSVFSGAVQQGIRLHRAIDEYTDHHPETRRATAYLAPACGRYAGVFMDVVYDHFLARDSRYFNHETLLNFSHQTYQTLDRYAPVFPERFRRVFYYMRTEDWLTGYQDTDHIASAFQGIYRRARYLEPSGGALLALERHYEPLCQAATAFLPDVAAFCRALMATAGKTNLCL